MSGLVSRAITGGSESYDVPLTPLRVFNRENGLCKARPSSCFGALTDRC